MINYDKVFADAIRAYDQQDRHSLGIAAVMDDVEQNVLAALEVTPEGVAAYQKAWHATPQGEPGDRTRAGLEAFLAHVRGESDK